MQVPALAAVLFALALIDGQAPGSRERSAQLQYVANAGVLLTIDGRKLLIDAPIRDGIPPYTTSSPEERGRLEGAQPPYDNVSAILVTHWHEDHFSPEAVAAHLRSDARTVLISSNEVVERVRAVAADLPPSRFRPVTPSPGSATAVDLDGLRVHVLRIRHNPTRRMPEQHVGFLVEGSRTVLHVGDAETTTGNFAVLNGLARVDLALLPFWFLTDDVTAATTVDIAIRPRESVGIHLPSSEADGVALTLQDKGRRMTLLRAPGQVLSLAPR